MSEFNRRYKASVAFYQAMGESIPFLQEPTQGEVVINILEGLTVEPRNKLLILAKAAGIMPRNDNLRKAQDAAVNEANAKAAEAKATRDNKSKLRNGFSSTAEARTLSARRSGLRYENIIVGAEMGKARAGFAAKSASATQEHPSPMDKTAGKNGGGGNG